MWLKKTIKKKKIDKTWSDLKILIVKAIVAKIFLITVPNDNDPDNDESAINSNYVSIVPCKFDLSSNKGQDYLKKNWKI